METFGFIQLFARDLSGNHKIEKVLQAMNGKKNLKMKLSCVGVGKNLLFGPKIKAAFS